MDALSQDERRLLYWERVRRVEQAIIKYRHLRARDDNVTREAVLFVEMLAAALSVPFDVGIEDAGNGTN